MRDQLSYEIYGIHIKVNEFTLQDELGFTVNAAMGNRLYPAQLKRKQRWFRH